MLQVQNLTKKYKNVTAVNDLSFSVERGTIFGILGPNGAGKTTTIRLILQILQPDSGSVLYDGRQLSQADKNIMGYLPEERGLYQKSRVRDVLQYFGRLKGLSQKDLLEKIEFWLNRLEIFDSLNMRIEELSKGNKQKIQFISAVLFDPEIIILDEPFSGFDPINQDLIREIITKLAESGKLVIISTHRMELAEDLCSGILLINRGVKILDGDLKELKYSEGSYQFSVELSGDDPGNLTHPLIESSEKIDDHFLITVEKTIKPEILLRELSRKFNIKTFSRADPALRDIFIQKVKRQKPIE